MTQNLWQKKLKLSYNENVIDIIQYGSSVIEEKTPRDADIAVLYQKIPLKEQLQLSQEIKIQLQKHYEKSIHITSFDLYSFFHKGNFAKEGILFYGRSLLTKDYFAKLFGLEPKIQINYSLQKLKKKEKIKFHYMLQGKSEKYGLLKKHGGKLISPGLIEIAPEHEHIFTERISSQIKDFNTKKVLYLI